MKKVLGLVLLMVFISSCSSIERATEKWKTPVDPEAGLAPGEKSNYLLNKEQSSQVDKISRPKKIKKKAIKKK